MKVLLVDDHMLFLRALRTLLTACGFEVIDLASNGREALDKVRALKPDVVLMDVHMPQCGGIAGVRLIKAEFPDVKVVMLTMSEDDNDLFDAIKSGASGYILKSVDSDDFLDLLSGVVRGEAAISREMAARIMQEFTRNNRPGALANEVNPAVGESGGGEKGLTLRQLDILRRIAHGETYKEIADTLHISTRTVNYHMTEILDKLQLQNRAQVIAYASRMGLLDDAVNSGPRSWEG
jgi:DNA-binding NarL/FixJ family response regulator